MKIDVGRAVACLGVVVCALVLAAPGRAQEVTGPAAAVAVDAGGEAGREALGTLSKDKQAAYRLEGDARRAALADVARRYVEMSADASRFRADERAEAAFRGGELHRTAKADDAARAAFESAARLGDGNDGEVFAARAWLELGHLARRAGEADLALQRYAVVADRFAGHSRPAAHAWTWRGKVALASGDLAGADAAVRGFLERFATVYPVEGIRNAERLAEALADAGHESDALALKADVERRIAAVRADLGTQTEAVDEALADFAVTSAGTSR